MNNHACQMDGLQVLLVPHHASGEKESLELTTLLLIQLTELFSRPTSAIHTKLMSSKQLMIPVSDSTMNNLANRTNALGQPCKSSSHLLLRLTRCQNQDNTAYQPTSQWIMMLSVHALNTTLLLLVLLHAECSTWTTTETSISQHQRTIQLLVMSIPWLFQATWTAPIHIGTTNHALGNAQLLDTVSGINQALLLLIHATWITMLLLAVNTLCAPGLTLVIIPPLISHHSSLKSSATHNLLTTTPLLLTGKTVFSKMDLTALLHASLTTVLSWFQLKTGSALQLTWPLKSVSS